MKIRTRFFSEIDIADSEIILFPFGVYGFEEHNRFVLLHDEEDENEMFMWLQSVDEENLCFVVMEPEKIYAGYSPKLPSDILRKIGAETENDIRYIVMSAIRKDIKKSTVNLLGPIVINPKKKVALQVVLDPSETQNSRYKTKYDLFSADDDFSESEEELYEERDIEEEGAQIC